MLGSVLYLIHGTWARKTSWIEASSLLSRELAHRTGVESPTAFRWSGKNRFYDRRKAQAELIRSLQEAAERRQMIVACAHSHGGGVLAYALQKCPAVRNHLVGAVFLSTPFFTVRLLPSWRILLNGLLAPIPLAIIFLVANLAFQLSAIVMAIYPFASGSLYESKATALMIVINWVMLLTAAFLLLLFNRLELKLARKALHRSMTLARALSCDLPADTKALFVRTSGDEAAAALSIVQTASWILLLFNEVVSKLFSIVTRTFRITRIKRPLLLIIGTFVIATVNARCLVDFLGRFNLSKPGQGFLDTSKHWTEMFWLASQIHISQDQYLSLAGLYYLLAVVWVLGAVAAVLILMFTVSTLVFICNWVISSAFGRMPFLRGGLVQVAVEMVPPGDWQVINASWASSGNKKTSLFGRHSNLYDDPKLVARIGDWIESNKKQIEKRLS